MSVATIWVVVEPANGSLTSTSLELLTHARSLASSVSAITWGEGSTLAAQAGEYGATTLYDVGDLQGALPGVPVAAAIAQLVAGNSPDAILIPTSYDGRDIAGHNVACIHGNLLDLTPLYTMVPCRGTALIWIRGDRPAIPCFTLNQRPSAWNAGLPCKG